MFADRLKQLMDVLEINNKTLADYAGLDPSSVSRLHNGKRILPRTSATIRKVVAGLISHADQTGKTDTLCQITGVDTSVSDEQLSEVISYWLYEDHEDLQHNNTDLVNGTAKTARMNARKQFGERFYAVLEISELSNIALSRKAHVDPSLISRYRSGLRSPASNPDIAELLSSVLFKTISESGRIEALSNLMNIPRENVNEEALSGWLCESALNSDTSFASTEKLLGALESHMIPTRNDLSNEDLLLLSEPISEPKALYKGYKGLREAVIRFLKEAERDHAKELLLFSNQNMEWMMEDPVFLRKWALLMGKCIKGGTKIRIIHNIDRHLEEMNSAIISWLPLYMTGMIEPFYSTLSTGTLFSRTIFLNPGISCINASLTAGTERDASYHYDTDRSRLDEMYVQFMGILNNSKPLVTVSASDDTVLSAGNLYIIQASPSLISMPHETASSFGSEIILNKWNRINELQKDLFEHRIYECITLPDPDELISGHIAAECIPGGKTEYYTPDSYRSHIKNMITLMDSYPGYRPIILPEMPFKNMQLLISEDSVSVTSTNEPFTVTSFSHPLMCQAFVNYAEKFIRFYRADKKKTTQRLQSAISS